MMGEFKSILFVVLSSVVLFSSEVFAGSDLIVRFKNPLNSKLTALKSLSKINVKGALLNILNSEEGIARLSFRSLDDARIAKAFLKRSNSISNVTANHLYEPAISYRFKTIFTDNDDSLGFLQTSVPDVLLPQVPMNFGVDPLAKDDWALDAINFHPPYEVKTSVVTAVIDTGVDYNHEDLIDSMWRSSDNSYEVGYDFAHNNATPFDLVHFDVEGCFKDFICRIGLDTSGYLVNPGHGTHCAGHVAAVYNNSLGISGIGVMSKIMALKFFYDYGEADAGKGDDAAAIKSIDYAIKNGAKVISASWGGRMKREEADSSELKQALVRAQKAGVLVVIAAGNDGVDLDTVDDPTFPASYELDNIISVAAIDQNDNLADFSCYGAKSVHIAAPGVKIFSTTSGNGYSDVLTKFTDGEGKVHQLDWDGTSMATPIVAGAAALIWSKYPEADYREVKRRILENVRKIPSLTGKVITGGVLDVGAALQ